MFKRLRWMSLGAVMGAGASAWARYRLRRAAFRRHPARVAARVGSEVRAALQEGRAAMLAKEAELRAGLERPARPALPAASRPVLTLVEDREATASHQRRRG